MTDPVLHVEREGPIAVLTLDRPKQMNALNAELRLALGRAFRELQADASVRVAIVTGAGRAFCAGMDLKEISGGAAGASGYDTSVAGQEEMSGAIAAFEGPILAAVNGPAVTAGFELALACDLIVASTRAVFIDSHARVGILPGWGLSVKLPRLIGVVRAKMVSLTGNYVSAEEAERWGLLARVVPAAELLPACRALARDMLSCDPRTMRGYKRLIDEGYGATAADARRHEGQVSTEHMKSVSAGDVASRRLGVVARGREQTR